MMNCPLFELLQRGRCGRAQAQWMWLPLVVCTAPSHVSKFAYVSMCVCVSGCVCVRVCVQVCLHVCVFM